MLDASLRLLAPRPGEVVVDGTLGNAGHALAILDRLGPAGRLVGIDRDPRRVARARARLKDRPADVLHGNFSRLDVHLGGLGLDGADAVLLDLGAASPQLDDAEAGFSYRREGPLDMRMNPEAGPSAADWLNRAPQKELADVLYTYGQERHSRRIARAIVARRQRAPLRTTTELADLIRHAVPGRRRRHHPARRSFQAIRIFINREIEHLTRFLERLPDWLNPGGRCVVISYHSLEDRPVKRAFLAGQQAGRYERLTRKPLRPTDEEVARNPRSRSAKLRAVRRLEESP
jgi:16S rRNA (cytosine1402-N4)-methyltransferase